MITFKKSQLRAALSHAPVKDVRHYLNGVLLEFTATGDVHIVATDGHRMFCGLIHAANVQWTDVPQKGPFSFIVPSETVKTACKGKGDVILAPSDGRYILGDFLFTPIDGQFPNWRQVIPDTTQAKTQEQYKWDQVSDANDALREWYGVKHSFPFHTYGNGLMHGDDCTAFCIVMPCRMQDPVAPFKPCTYE